MTLSLRVSNNTCVEIRMARPIDRPWRSRLPGISKLGLVLLLVGLVAFGYGIVQRGLPSRDADLRSADLMAIVAEEIRRMEQETDPEARERLRQRINNLSFSADMSLMESREREAQHAYIAIFGAITSVAGIIVLATHRRRTQNLV
jgi:hypothetical protein